jgi:hypothetical protein
MNLNEVEVAGIIEELVGAIDNSIVGTYDAENDYTLFCLTKWARVGKKLYDEVGNEFLITDIEPNVWIKATNKDLVTLNGKVYLNAPFFISGTKLATSLEWTKKDRQIVNKTPLIWLLEFISLEKYGRESALDFNTELRIFFVDETNIAQYKNKEHRTNVVSPMGELLNEFIGAIRNDRAFKTLESYNVTTFSRFGTESEAGAFQNILDANLSGLELTITLNRFKKTCKNCI